MRILGKISRASVKKTASGLLGLFLCLALMPAWARAQGSRENQTLLKVNVPRGFVTVFVNGQKVGTFGQKTVLANDPHALTDKDVSALVRPGKNALKVVWSGKSAPLGSVNISYAKERNAFRKVAGIDFGVMNKNAASKTVSFNLPKADGTFAQTPTKSGEAVGPGSRARQTLMTANITRGDITVFVNGKKVGSYTSGSLVPLDISNYIKGGENTVRLVWDESIFPVGSVSISYAARPSRFRKVATYDMGTFTKKKGGTSVTFSLPAEAAK